MLTKREAIRRSIKQWTWCAETGKNKYDWPGLTEYGHMACACALCEYSERHDGCVDSCPYYQKFRLCMSGYYYHWVIATTTEAMKKYASLFLEELKQL